MPILVKISWPDGTSARHKFADDACVNDMIDFVKSTRPDAPPPSFYSGYPPNKLIFESKTTLLASLGIVSGQLIIIKEGETPNVVRRIIDGKYC